MSKKNQFFSFDCSPYCVRVATSSGYCCAWERGYCNWVCYRGSSEMCQIWVQWWHFLTAVGYCWFWLCFITKVWSVDHKIIVIYINGVWQWLFPLKRNHLFFQWKLVLAKILFCSILNFGISYCILEFCPYNVQSFAKNSPVILQKWARMKN